ncbi:centrosomal protein of 44 kDa [Stegastes partitus]|uniref:Centrosomal protein of 44 kDa n=1 Tax=Stegastes partitus TaxID=144197 RepID=A0A3B4ZIA3_9TELE|nr:PREDICTED: centrosomal protein of 44 kDa [Stegastes partitus]
MLSTGDVQGCLRKLETLLRLIKYPGHVDYDGLSKGDPSAFLPIVSFTLNSFSPLFAEELMASGLELTGKTDLRFTDALYKALRDIFHYKPVLTKQQFLQWGFSQRKISVLCDIINLVMQKHSQLKKHRVRCPASQKYGRGEAPSTATDAAGSVAKRPFVVHHTENPSTYSTVSSHNVTSASHNEAASAKAPGDGTAELPGREEDKDYSPQSSEVEGRLSALEAQVQTLLPALDRLSVLEKRLDELERQRNADKNEGQVISVSRESWENLMSRLLLLETKLELSNAQISVPLPCQSFTSSSMSDSSKENLKDRLERITHMLKSTSSLLKNPESSTTPCE